LIKAKSEEFLKFLMYTKKGRISYMGKSDFLYNETLSLQRGFHRIIAILKLYQDNIKGISFKKSL